MVLSEEIDLALVEGIIMEQADRNSALYREAKLNWCMDEFEKAIHRLNPINLSLYV
jgi:hypothetical protein